MLPLTNTHPYVKDNDFLTASESTDVAFTYLATPKYIILLRLNNITLVQFKNYRKASFQFTGRIVGICGKNGVGKTNLLDAIYYCCFTKSYFTRSDLQNVHSGDQGFRLAGILEKEATPFEIVCILRETGRKEIYVNNEGYLKFSDHIGKFPVVVIAPDDVHIITEGSEERRRFLDALLSQVDHSYLVQLISYNKVLAQRNSLLKAAAETRRLDNSLLEVLNEQLATPGAFIFEKRKNFLKDFIPLVHTFYQKISGQLYDLIINYESQLLHTSFENLLHQLRDKDLILQRTNGGIHKDDLDLSLQGNAFRNVASQGQRKSLLFALKLAEFEVLKNTRGFPPLLLLDDVFEKLDRDRMTNLLQWVCTDNDGQIFITDTHRERLQEHFQQFSLSFQLIEL